jgi:hypothetical protein
MILFLQKWKKWDYKDEHWKKDISGPSDSIIKPWTDYSKVRPEPYLDAHNAINVM